MIPIYLLVVALECLISGRGFCGMPMWLRWGLDER
jgi:hypothetical protein